MRNQKGITLIALVITIIVLLILAGVTIAMLSGDNGILTRATTTKEANAESTAREQANLAYVAVRTEIAAKKVQTGTYQPTGDDTDLISIVDNDLGTDWTVTSSLTTPPGGSSANAIKLVFTNSALNNTNHQLTYYIILDNTNVTATISGPTEGYKQISNS